MAKVIGPLMSFGASGQIAKTLVFMTWKGVKDVRQYVIPANPNTPLQDAQRTILENAVDEYHKTHYTAADKTAWDKFAGILAQVMTGFNAFVKTWIDIVVAGTAVPSMPWGASLISDGPGTFACAMNEDGPATAARLHWGYSKTALNNIQALAQAPAGYWSATLIAATVGTIVYARFETYGISAPEGYSGIYEVTIV